MDDMELAEAKAQIFKALGHPVRIRMVEALAERSHCVCELVEMVPGTQATTSRHLDVLFRAGIVGRRREGVKMIYELAMPCLLKTMPCVIESLRKRLDAEAAVLEGHEA
jgi:DNA-binding transcriptional ArsR family regulator